MVRPSRNRVFLFIVLAVFPLATIVHAQDPCLSSGKLSDDFTNELALTGKPQIRFVPFKIASKESPRNGLVLQDVESCGIRGNCDSRVYLSDAKDPKCYRNALSFNGHWLGVDQRRKVATVLVDGRAFELNEKTSLFEEKKK